MRPIPESENRKSKIENRKWHFPSQSETRARFACEILEKVKQRFNRRFRHSSCAVDLLKYKRRPWLFAKEVLGSHWWYKQKSVATALVNNKRVVVKSANGVGKTYLAADLALWFLYTHQPCIVLTTAPTWRQVRHLLWEEIRKRWATARGS